VSRRQGIVAAVAVVVALALLAAWQFGVFGGSKAPGKAPPVVPAIAEVPPGYVGSAACRDCHAQEYQRWQGSQHAVAMQVADERTCSATSRA